MTKRRKTKATQLHEDAPVYYIDGNVLAHTLKFIDLFCGIGGFRIAFERAGCECVFSSDWNKYAQVTYEANFGEKPHGDIHSVAVADIPTHDTLRGVSLPAVQHRGRLQKTEPRQGARL